MSHEDLLHKIDEQRAAHGFHGVTKLLALSNQGNTFLDLFSILISTTVELGEGNIFYPNVIVQAKDGGKLVIGDENVFYPNALILAEKGQISIGNGNQFGDGGCSLKANMPDAKITVGDSGRYSNGVQIIGQTTLGSGSQVLGPVTVQDCILAAGEDYRFPEPELRAGLLKGSGLARNLTVPRGKVIKGVGTFAQADIEEQAKYHPRA